MPSNNQFERTRRKPRLALPHRAGAPLNRNVSTSQGISMKHTNQILIVALIALSGCVTPYKAPTSGPQAYVKFTDNMGASITGGRKTGVHFFEDADCSKRTYLGSDDWVAVPANKPIGFHQFWDNRGAGFVQGYCGVWAMLELKEGQRVEIAYNFAPQGLRWHCSVKAQEKTSSGETLFGVPVKRLEGEQCKW